MLDADAEAYVAVIVEAAERDVSIARVLREICALDGPVRAAALGVVATHLHPSVPGSDVFECLEALRRDDIARRIAERLGPPG